MDIERRWPVYRLILAGHTTLEGCKSLTLEDVDMMGDALDSWEAAERRMAKKARENSE